MSWSRAQVSQLIELYEQHECLYAIKSKLYHNRVARTNALEVIKMQLVKAKPDVTIAEIKYKFNALRTNLLNEYRKYKESISSGIGEDEVYKPTIWYFDSMQFLLDHVTIRKSVAIIAVSEEAEVENDSQESTTFHTLENINVEFLHETSEQNQRNSNDEFGTNSRTTVHSPIPSTSVTPTTNKKRKKDHSDRNTDEKLLESIGGAVNIISKSLEKKESRVVEIKSSEHIFGEFIASELAKVTDEDILYEAKRDIIQITFDALHKVRQL